MTSIEKPVITSYKQFYTSPWGIAFIAYFVAMGLVGAFTPADILKANPWAREFCDFMANIVPQIDKVTALNIAPDINRFYFSVMWAGSPFLFVFMVCAIWLTRKDDLADPKKVWRQPFYKSLLMVIPFGFLALAVLHFPFDAKDATRLMRSTFQYAIGRTVMPQCFVLAPVLCAGATFNLLIGWLTGYIPRNIKYHNELEKNNG
jgi:hypothetical protein